MDGQVQASVPPDEPMWKAQYRRLYHRLFGWWERGVPPTWLVVAGCLLVQVRDTNIVRMYCYYFVHLQVGFGLYPVVVKEFAAKEKANPVIFSFYRSAAAACEYSVDWC